MQKTLSQKQLGHALFYSIKKDDLEHAQYLLSIDAPVNTSFFIDQETIVYTTNLMTEKVAQVIKKCGVSHARSQLALRIMDRFIEQQCDLRCHCNPKNSHYCALSQAFKHINLRTQDDLLIEQNLLILKLIYHGATYKNHNNQKSFSWNAINILKSYIDTKKQEVIELIKMNRHAKGCNNRHSKCTVQKKVNLQKTKI